MRHHWNTHTLDSLCEFLNGLWTGKKPPYVKVGVLRNTNFDKSGGLNFEDVAYLDVELSQFKKRKLLYGDIILEKSGGGPKQPVGRVAIFNKKEGEFSFSNFTSAIRVKDASRLDYKFLHLYLNFEYISGATEQMQSHSTGIRNLKLDNYKKLEIPLPPLPEQQRIVALLDEAFAAIAKAKANTEKNLLNARELFESYLNGVFYESGKDWIGCRLEEIIESNVVGLTKNSREQRDGYKYKYVKMNNITRDNRFDLSKYICVNATSEEVKKYSLQNGDFLFNTRNSHELVGKTCLFESNESEVVLYNNNIMRIRFIKSIDAHFINYSFTTRVVTKKIETLKSGTTNVAAIYYKDLKNLDLLIPPLQVQQTIVKNLNNLSIETKKLEAHYRQKLASLEELKKSILQKAFRGELTEKEIVV